MQVTDWSTEHLAYLFENFNGWESPAAHGTTRAA